MKVTGEQLIIDQNCYSIHSIKFRFIFKINVESKSLFLPNKRIKIDRYNSSTGTFIVPPGGDGFYYSSTYLLGANNEYGVFNIRVNGERLCTAVTQQLDTPGDPGQAACSAAIYATEGISK